MTTRVLDRMVDAYLSRLEEALDGIPERRRRQLVAEVGGRIEARRLDLTAESEAGIRAVLAEIGPPEDLAAEELSFHPWSSRRSRLRRGAAFVIALSLVAAGSATVVASTHDPSAAEHGPTVTVPDLIGRSEAAAIGVLRSAHLTPGRTVEVQDATAPAGTVAGERPSAGSTVRRESRVALEISAGA